MFMSVDIILFNILNEIVSESILTVPLSIRSLSNAAFADEFILISVLVVVGFASRAAR